MLHTLWQKWLRLLDDRESGTSLALFRMACGICILVSLGSVVAAGMVETIWLQPKDGGFQSFAPGSWLFRWLGGPTRFSLWLVLSISLVGGLLLVVGLGGRLTALLALQAYHNVARLNPMCVGGYDWLLTNALWLVFLSNASATLSLDCRIRTGRWFDTTPISAWPRYLAIFQLVLMYWSTGIHKQSAAWFPGEEYLALYYILQEPIWQRQDMLWLAYWYRFTQCGAAIAWLWEATAPGLLLLLWLRRTHSRGGFWRSWCQRLPLRALWITVGLCMHVGLWLSVDVGPFSLIALSFYCCLFKPTEWEQFGNYCISRVKA